jgi:glycosyltransferase involved in cell wall biosynthesis
MSEMEGSPEIFLENTSQFLAKTPYKKAHQLAIKMAKEYQTVTKISVVIPFYNRISLTIEAVRSVLMQDHQQFEILLVDDGSTDDLGALLDLIKTDLRIQYIRQNNAGPAKARNNGVKRATGAYIAFLDSDDLFYPEKLKIQLEYMRKNSLVLSHTSYHRFDFEGNLIAPIASGKVSGNIFPGIIASCGIALPTVMGRADIFKNNPFPDNFEIGEDVCLWIKLASKYEFAGIDVAYTKVRVGHLSASLNKRKQEIGYINIAYYVIQDKFMAQFKPQIKSLLLDVVANLTEVRDGPRTMNVPEVPAETDVKVSLFNKVSSFYAQHGFINTARKVVAVISRRLT